MILTRALTPVGRLFGLGIDVVRLTFAPPFQLREYIEQTWFVTKVSALPTALFTIPFGATIALLLGNLTGQFGAQSQTGAGSVLATRADDAARAAVRKVVPEAAEDAVARCIWVARGVPEPRGLVAVISAGTSDGPVVREVRIRAELLGTTVVVHEDVGVAGVHRLGTALPDLEQADCVVVVAGMDGALASLVGGLARGPVIGVPTSVGYGSAHGGTTALNAMLASCAAGLAVVGIDDGLGAGTIAARIARGRE